MKKNNLTRGAFALLLLASTVAGADQQYPAADFQPEVLYQDSDYIAKNSPSTTASKAPASTTNAASSAAAGNGNDSKYPAANFQPEVLYHDPNYKPSTAVKATVSKEVKEAVGSTTAESQSVSSTAASKEESSMLSYLIGLVVLALAGFYFFKNRSTAPVQKKAPAPAKTSYALTGVAKYLNKVSGTGVSRYLEKHVKSASATTGVAKYMAKQAASPKTTAAKAATGVEKYMRDRG
ncbi:MAG: hypothetical protein LUQ56_00270 [Methylococcaceae bacterium]|nr:hypothetical protein [Methylococcaceae bacterium]OYV20203.1 MAG: hypothetical protein CG441_472 [Methylococcaceae bacterium NSM2-1]